MPRPSTHLKLSDIEPKDIALLVVGRVVQHIGRFAFGLQPGVMVTIRPDPPDDAACMSTTLGMTAHDLAVYARGGLCKELDWEDDSCARDAVQSVCEALYSRAGEDGFGVGPLEDGWAWEDTEHPVSLVLCAAWARIAIAGGEEVPPQCLGALSGLSKRSIYDLIDRGDIEAGGDRGSTVIEAAVAKRWLAARGVKGL